MAKQRNKLLIVDGYNVLRSGSRYKNITRQPDYTPDVLNVLREKLINDVCCYAGRDMRAVVVFDAGKNPYSMGSQEMVGGVRVMFSPAGSSADKIIEKLAHEARARRVETLVVTSDATIQDTVFGGGIDRMSAEGFCQEIAMYYEGYRYDRMPEVSKKMIVRERVSQETVKQMEDLRDTL